MCRVRLALLLLTVAACNDSRTPGPARRYGLGRAATPADVASRDIDAGPDGVGLPAGNGTAAAGQTVYAQKCASCHGASGEGLPPANPRLIGRDPQAEGFPFGRDPRLVKTIGNYWPYATTVFDYVRRAMPPDAPGSLSDSDVYNLTAFLLHANDLIQADAVIDASTLPQVKMPALEHFVPDTRRR